MAVANAADDLEIAGRRRRRAERCSHNRLGNEGDGAALAQFGDRHIEALRRALGIIFVALSLVLVAVCKARLDQADGRNQNWIIELAPRFVAGNGQRADRVAVIGMPAGNEMIAGRFAALDPKLAGKFQCRLRRLRAAGDEKRPPRSAGSPSREAFCQLFRRSAGEEGRMDELKLLELPLGGLDHARMTVAEAGNGGPARGIEILLACRIAYVAALPADGGRIA